MNRSNECSICYAHLNDLHNSGCSVWRLISRLIIRTRQAPCIWWPVATSNWTHRKTVLKYFLTVIVISSICSDTCIRLPDMLKDTWRALILSGISANEKAKDDKKIHYETLWWRLLRASLHADKKNEIKFSVTNGVITWCAPMHAKFRKFMSK